MKEAYCGNCERSVGTKLMKHGAEDLIKVCARCDNVMLFPSERAWIDHVHERVMKQVTCDHQFAAGDHHLSVGGECDYCALPEGCGLAKYSRRRN